MEALRQEDEIIEAAETRLVELGSEIGQRMLAGKDSPDILDQGQRLFMVKRAYHAELEDKEKEALLYCMRKLSDQFDVPAATGTDIFGPLIPEPEEEVPFVDFYIGSLTDVDGHIGTEEDVADYIGT